MAEVKGLKIEIEADVTGVKKAFKELTSESKTTETQLKEVNRALKFDPDNVVLIEQKQKLLADAIEKTKGQLEQAEAAQKEFVESGGDIDSDQYTQLQIETEKLRGHLEYLEGQAEETAGGLEESADSTEQVTEAMDNASGSTGAWEVALGNLISNGIQKLTTALGDAVKGTFGLADNVLTLANNYGVSATAAYTLYQNQDLLDYSVGGLTRSMKEQYKELANGTDAYDELGITVKDANGDLLSQEKILVNTLEYLRGIDDPVQRAAEGVELLGNKYYEMGGILNTDQETFDSFKNGLLEQDEALEGNISGLVEFKDMIDGAKVALTDAAVSLGEFFGWLSDLDGLLPAILTVLTGLVAAWVAFGGAAKTAAAVQGLLNAVMAANPIGLVVIAVTALVAAFILLWNNCEEFREFWIKLWEKVKTSAQNAWKKIKGYFTDAWNVIKGIWGVAVTFFTGIWNGIKAVFSVVEAVLKGDFQGAWNGVKGIWEGAKTFFSDLWKQIKDVFSDASKIGTQIMEDILSGLTAMFHKVASQLKGWWEGIKTWFNNNPATGKVGTSTVIDKPGSRPGGATGEAYGLDYVPYNGFLASLHQGEAVLTASQANVWRNSGGGGGGSTVTINTQSLSQADIDYIVTVANRELGAAI